MSRPTRSPAIRIAFAILVSLLIAGAIAIGAFALLQRVQHGPPPRASGPIPTATVLRLPEPARLPRLPSGVPVAAAFEVEQLTASCELSIEVRNFDAAHNPGAGVAVIAADTGIPRTWLPLPNAPANVARLTAVVPTGDVWVYLAPSALGARHHYWVRAKQHLRASTPTTVRLSGGPTKITILPTFVGGAAPVGEQNFTLARIGEPEWRLPDGNGPTPRLLTAKSEAMETALGPGDYELAPLADTGWKPVRFSVPATAPLRVEFTR